MSHSHTKYLCHFTWSTRSREARIDPSIEGEVYAYRTNLFQKHSDHVFAINAMSDHVHVIAQLKGEPSAAKVIKDAKSYSSGWFKRRFGRAAFFWQRGFAGFSISQSQLDKAVNYVRGQKAHHEKKGFTFVEELKTLCKLHGVKFDESMLD